MSLLVFVVADLANHPLAPAAFSSESAGLSADGVVQLKHQPVRRPVPVVPSPVRDWATAHDSPRLIPPVTVGRVNVVVRRLRAH